MAGRSVAKAEQLEYLTEYTGNVLRDYYKKNYDRDVQWDTSVHRHDIVQAEFYDYDRNTGEWEQTIKHLCRVNSENKVRLHVLPYFVMDMPKHYTIEKGYDDYGYPYENSYYDEVEQWVVYACPDCGKIIYVIL